jgi:hypothetical protein
MKKHGDEMSMNLCIFQLVCQLDHSVMRYIYMTRDFLNQVREMLERHLDAVEIANRMNVDLDTVRTAADIIRELLT